MGTLPVAKISVEEYLALDRAAETPSEYHDGEMFPSVAVTWQHGFIQANTMRRVAERLDESSCRASGSLRVRVSPTKFVVPDMLVVCGKPAVVDSYQDTITNPKVVIEVLSPTTANYDYGGKFTLYRRLESFEEYVLISQDRARIEVFRKASDRQWMLNTYEGLDSIARVETLNLALPLVEIYAGVDLPEIVD